MSFDFHHNKQRYFEHQYLNSKNYVIPFIRQKFDLQPGMKVLEIGCAEGGVLKAFTDLGCVCTGVELSSSKVENAHKFMKDEVSKGLIKFICKNIYEVDFKAEFQQSFDLIVLKDTIEHIHQQENIIAYLKEFLTSGGQIYFGFPPWHMPWGGHQQICTSKFLMFFPYFHLLPLKGYRFILKIFGETASKIEVLVEIKETGISTHRFESILRKSGYKIVNRCFFFINPIYRYKFGWRPTRQWSWFSKMPVIRDFMSTTVYYSVAVD